MEISCFDDLLQAARVQPEPQRLLFVFAGVELPDDATPAQRERFAQGEGGALVPQMCVDKAPDELASFDALVQEAAQFGKDWTLVFAAAMSGTLNRAPTSGDAELPLESMVDAIKRGVHSGLIPFDRTGHTVQID
ncbi:MAG: ribonucleotide reductase subunit alpha [Giesbergeria sp.]